MLIEFKRQASSCVVTPLSPPGTKSPGVGRDKAPFRSPQTGDGNYCSVHLPGAAPWALPDGGATHV